MARVVIAVEHEALCYIDNKDKIYTKKLYNNGMINRFKFKKFIQSECLRMSRIAMNSGMSSF